MRTGMEEREVSKLYLTSFNTIKGDDFNEIFVADFFNVLNNNLDKEFGAYFIEESKNFKIVLDGEGYYLVLDENVMNNYLLGRYNDFTRELRSVIEKTEKRDKGELTLKNDVKKKEEIIKRAEQGIIPDTESRRIYLEHLRKTQKFSFKKIESYFENLIGDFKKSWSQLNDWALQTRIFPYNKIPEVSFWFWISIVASIITCSVSIVSYVEIDTAIDWWKCIRFSLIPQIVNVVPGIKLIQNQINNRYLRFLEFCNNKKINSYKIKQLTSELKYGPRELVDKTYTELANGKDKEKPTSAILQELSEVASRIKYLKEEDKKVCFDMAMAILDEYTKRAKEINLVNSSEGIVLALDGDLSLKSDVMSKIKQLSDEIAKRMDVTIKNKGIDNDYEIVARQIEGYYCYYSDDKVIVGERITRSKKLN